MRRPRGKAKAQQLEDLRAEAPWVRLSWELGRVYRRAGADLRSILANSIHHRVFPIRAGDPRVVRQQVDRHLQEQLRKRGSFDEHGLIYGGESRIAHRPFKTETIDAIRSAHRALDDALLHAAFSTSLERIAFHLSPKDASEDCGGSTEPQWQDAWLEITDGTYTKGAACQAIGISQHAYDERQRRRRAKAGGLSRRDEKRNAMLRELIAEENKGIENHQQYRRYIDAIASERGHELPRSMRIPRFTKATCKKLPEDCRFYAKELERWQALLPRQPRKSQPLWRQLIELRQERIAGMVSAIEICEWTERNLKKPTDGNKR